MYILTNRPVFLCRARLAMRRDILFQEPLPEILHGRHLVVPSAPVRGVLAGAGSHDDFCRQGSRVRWRHRSMTSDGHLHRSTAEACLDDVDLAAGRVDSDPEALEVVVPDHALAVRRREGVHGPFGDLGHRDGLLQRETRHLIGTWREKVNARDRMRTRPGVHVTYCCLLLLRGHTHLCQRPINKLLIRWSLVRFQHGPSIEAAGCREIPHGLRRSGHQ